MNMKREAALRKATSHPFFILFFYHCSPLSAGGFEIKPEAFTCLTRNKSSHMQPSQCEI